MSVIKLVDTGWSMIPEGKTVLKVTDVDYDSDFGKLEIKMTSQEGHTHSERYRLINKKGESNDGANKAFSFFAKTALNNFALDAIDPNDLIDCYVSATIEHVESDTISEKTGEPFVNVRLNNLKAAVGFEKSEHDEFKKRVADMTSELDELMVSDDDIDDFLD